MTLINVADNVYLGTLEADRVYAGSTLVWPPASEGEWGPAESVYPATISSLTHSQAQPLTLGSRIEIRNDGRVTHIRYYRLPDQGTSRYVALWSDTGTLLASGTTSGEVDGWNTYAFDTPVIVAAGQVVRPAFAYNGTGDGTFVWQYDSTNIPTDTTHLDWLRGVYDDTGPAQFPNFNNGNNYYADIVYQPLVDAWAPAESLYPLTTTPAAGGSYDGSFSVGNGFTVAVDGRIVALRYYRPSGTPASRNVSLWTGAGALLASVAATGGAVGWNTVAIPPIDMTAGSTYRVAHGYSGSGVGDLWPYTNTSLVSADPGLTWTAGVYSLPLAAGAGGEDDFPDQVTGSYHYFADVVFQEALEEPVEPPEPTHSLLLTYAPGSDRNDFDGEVGVRVGIGAAPVTVEFIGVRTHAGATGTRTVKLYEWFSGAVQRTVTVDLTGHATNEYVWGAISPITLAAGGYYALLMVCTAGGPIWSNPGPCTMAASIVNIYDSYYYSGLQTGTPNSMFVGLDLGWT